MLGFFAIGVGMAIITYALIAVFLLSVMATFSFLASLLIVFALNAAAGKDNKRDQKAFWKLTFILMSCISVIIIISAVILFMIAVPPGGIHFAG